MAVKHLQNTQRQHLAMAMATDPSVLRKFKTGFNECSKEIDRYISTLDGVDDAMKQRITSHLQKCISSIEHVAQFNFPGFNSLPFLTNTNIFSTQKINESVNTGDQNNNPHIQIPQGIQLIPSRLPSGEVALIVPNTSNLPYFPQVVPTQNNARPSAFAAVIPHSSTSETIISKPLSPPISPIHIHEDQRSMSPQGFRPVHKYSGDHQVPQITSTFSENHSFVKPEVKTMKYPIHKSFDKRHDSPKKLAEPLCIITNQSERYKQAQTKEDSAHYEENLQRGLKREHSLLTIADFPQPAKILKLEAEAKPSGSDAEPPSSPRDLEANESMWRPWWFRSKLLWFCWVRALMFACRWMGLWL